MSVPAIVPYDAAQHGDGPWRVVSAVFAEYGLPFEESDYDADLLNIPAHYAPPGGGFAVAEEQGKSVTGCVGFTDEGQGTFELHRLYVLASARRGGLGRRLVKWVIDEVGSRGGERIVLYSDVAFEDAHRLYRRMGFRCIRFRYAPDPFQSREWGFALDLPGGR